MTAQSVILLLVFMAIKTYGERISVASFQMDGRYSNETHMNYLGNFTHDLTNMTQCLRVKLAHLRGVQTVFLNYANQDEVDGLTSAFVDKFDGFFLDVCRLKYKNSECVSFNVTYNNTDNTLVKVEFMQWMHICTTFEIYEKDSLITTTYHGVSKTYINGKRIEKQGYKLSVVPFDKLAAGGSLILGQYQERPWDFDVAKSFSGEISQVGIWDRILTPGEIENLAICKSNEQGNQVNWDMSNWNISTAVKIREEELSSLCTDSSLLRKLILTEKVSYEDLFYSCYPIGNPPTPKSVQELKDYSSDIRAAFDELPDDWRRDCEHNGEPGYTLGYELFKDEWWYYEWENETQEFATWDQLNVTNTDLVIPEGKKKSLFAAGDQVHSQYYELAESCAVCYLKKSKILQLKGLCKQKQSDQVVWYDKDYYIYGQLNGKPHIRGVKNSHIYFERDYSGKSGKWRLESFHDPDYTYEHMQTTGFLPMGTHTFSWSPENCNEVSGGYGQKRQLTLSACGEKDFTCDNGRCIKLDYRCDAEIDCFDSEDEANCTYVSVKPSYVKTLMPRGYQVTRQDSSVDVKMNISILALPVIDTANLLFTVDYVLNLRWYDERVDIQDLNNVSVLNTLNEDIVHQLWKPKLSFVNALGPYQTVYDDRVYAIVVKESDPQPVDLTKPKEARSYDSRKNSIMMSREYFLEYSCKFDLTYYPFDTQVCTMRFQILGKTDDYVVLSKDFDGIEFLDSRQLIEYEILKEDLIISEHNNMSQAEARIVFRRRIEYHLYNTVTQTLILIFVGYMSYYFDLDDFNDRIMVTLTTMLVIATTTAAIQADLPKTSNFKMIDWWLFFASNILVVTMAFHTYLAFLCEMAKSKMDSTNSFKERAFWIPRLNLTKKKNERPSKDKLVECCEDKNGAVDETSTLNNEEDPQVSIKDDQDQHQAIRQARRFNDFAKVIYLAIVVTFNIIFWFIAVTEYSRPAEYYLGDFGNRNQTTDGKEESLTDNNSTEI